MNNENNPDYEELRNYVWNYFHYHASQRLTTFYFYIFISSIIDSGYFLAIRFVPYLAIILGIFLLLLSFVFWKLDCRNRELIKYSCEALEYIETKDAITESKAHRYVLNIFTRDLKETEKLKKKGVRWHWYTSLHYSTCFNIVFISFSVIGFGAIVCAIINIFWPF